VERWRTCHHSALVVRHHPPVVDAAPVPEIRYTLHTTTATGHPRIPDPYFYCLTLPPPFYFSLFTHSCPCLLPCPFSFNPHGETGPPHHVNQPDLNQRPRRATREERRRERGHPEGAFRRHHKRRAPARCGGGARAAANYKGGETRYTHIPCNSGLSHCLTTVHHICICYHSPPSRCPHSSLLSLLPGAITCCCCH